MAAQDGYSLALVVWILIFFLAVSRSWNNSLSHTRVSNESREEFQFHNLTSIAPISVCRYVRVGREDVVHGSQIKKGWFFISNGLQSWCPRLSIFHHLSVQGYSSKGIWILFFHLQEDADYREVECNPKVHQHLHVPTISSSGHQI